MDFYSKTTDELSLKMLRFAEGKDDFNNQCHIHVTDVYDGIGEGVLEVTPQSLNPLGIIHGGCLATLADTVAGMAAACTSGKPFCVTVNYALNFLRPALATNKQIHCIAKPRKLGRTLCVYEIALTDDQEKIVATGDFTFFTDIGNMPTE